MPASPPGFANYAFEKRAPGPRQVFQPLHYPVAIYTQRFLSGLLLISATVSTHTIVMHCFL